MIKNYILNASGSLDTYIEDLEKISRDSVARVQSFIPVENVDIVIVDNPRRAIPEIGIGGHTYSQNYIEISLNPDFSNFHQSLDNELLDTLAHELHHAARWQAIGYGNTLLEAMVSEGLADQFAIEITKRQDMHLWDKALTDEEKKLLIKRAVQEYNNKNYNHIAWFFGSKEKEIPRWTAYTLGFDLIDTYLKGHVGSKASILYALEAKEFI